MKWSMLIFAFYILTLSCIPCYGDVMQAGKAIELQAADTGHHEKERAEGNCNPFFSCNCCSGTAFFFQRTFSITKPILLGAGADFNIADQHFTSYNCHNIWQPPRV